MSFVSCIPSSSLLSLLCLLYFTLSTLCYLNLIEFKDICRGNSNFTCNQGIPLYQKLPHAYMILVFLFYSLLSLLPLLSLLSLLCFVFLFFFFLLIYVNQAQVRKETDLSGILVVDAEIQWITKAEEEVIANVCSSLPPPLSPLLSFYSFFFSLSGGTVAHSGTRDLHTSGGGNCGASVPQPSYPQTTYRTNSSNASRENNESHSFCSQCSRFEGRSLSSLSLPFLALTMSIYSKGMAQRCARRYGPAYNG